MSISERYSIKDLEKLSGIKAHTIRIWEKRYSIIKPHRTGTNIRYYSNHDLVQLLNISLLNKSGIKISSIANMSVAERSAHLSNLALANDCTHGTQENLLLSLIELDEPKFNQVYLSLVLKTGFEQTFIKVIFPFFNRIGLMWQTGAINPAQEHFFSNIIRQKLVAATNALEIPAQPGAPAVLLLLPEHELHEIGLLFYNYAFRARGYKTIYLGQSVPLEGLDKIISTCQPGYVVTGMTSSINPIGFEQYVLQLKALLPGQKIFYTGPVPQSLAGNLPDSIMGVNELRLLLNL